MPAVVVDSSVLVSLAPGEQFHLLRTFYSVPLLLVDDAQGRRAAAALNIAYTGTLGVLLRGKAEGKIPHLRSVLELLKQRTTFWLSQIVYEAALKQAGESSTS